MSTLGGRPPRLSDKERERVIAMFEAGARVTEIARLFRVSRGTIYRAIDQGPATRVGFG